MTAPGSARTTLAVEGTAHLPASTQSGHRSGPEPFGARVQDHGRGAVGGHLARPPATAGAARPKLSNGSREVLFRAVLVFAGLACAALAAEVLTRLIAPQRLYRYPPGLYESHPTRAYRLAPNFRGKLSTPEYRTDVIVNSRGLREDGEYTAKAPGTFRILVLGDSFVAGIGVEARETFAKLAADRLNANASAVRFEAINAGVPSYSTREEVLYLEEEGFELQPDVVLLALFIGNDIVDNTRTSWSRVVDGELVDGEPRTGVLPLAIRRILSRHSHLYHFLWPYQRWLLGRSTEDRLAEKRLFAIYDRPDAASSAPAWQATELWIERLTRITREHNVPLGVLIIPEQLQLEPAAWEAAAKRLNAGAAEYTLERPNQRLAEMLHHLRVPIFDLLSVLRSSLPGHTLYFRSDGHWTPEGHRLVADAMVGFLQNEGLIQSSGTHSVF